MSVKGSYTFVGNFGILSITNKPFPIKAGGQEVLEAESSQRSRTIKDWNLQGPKTRRRLEAAKG
ncbi:hypothetical protein J6590_027679 [Homalodisca vitripennis]|nr:hypothetical protein J6590_027679 [Homalodisca vitripennis]